MTRDGQEGFVLALTLWIMAAIALGVGLFAERVSEDLRLAHAGQQHVQDRIDMAGTRADILFRLATTPMSTHGLGPFPPYVVELDGRPYQGEGKTVVRLQDDRGLVDLNLVDDDALFRLLGVLGVPYDDRIQLTEALKDYIDRDDFRRLNGAEQRDYAGLGKNLPRNDKLLSPRELVQVKGWKDHPELMDEGKIFEYTTTSQASAINPLTASGPVLAVLPNMTPDLAETLTLQKQNHQDLSSLLSEVVSRNMGSVIDFPSNSVRVTHYAEGSSIGYRYDVTLTPNAEDRPWRINYSMNLERKMKYETAMALETLPRKDQIPEDTGQSILPF